MIIMAIDPGPTESGWCILEPDGQAGRIRECGSGTPNQELERVVVSRKLDGIDTLAIEQVMSYGRPVGASVFETVYWSGRFARSWSGSPGDVLRIPFVDVKIAMCHDSRAKESHVRQAVRDRFPRTGGGKRPEIGTKQSPGPLYQVTGHAWSALAVALTAAQRATTCCDTVYDDESDYRHHRAAAHGGA